MSENLLYCLLGIAGGGIISFLVSLLFYNLGFFNKCLLVDLISPGDKPDSTRDYVLILRNIGKQIIDMSDFVKANKPAIDSDGIESYKIVPPSFQNCVKANIRQKNNRLAISFDFLKPKEQLVIIIFGAKGIVTLLGTLKDGKIISLRSIMDFAKRKRIFTIPSVMMLSSIMILVNRSMFVSIIISLLLGFDIGLDAIYLWTYKKRIQNTQWIENAKNINVSRSEVSGDNDT